MIFLFANDASSTLAAPISNTSVSLTVASGQGAEFPNPSAGQQFEITLNDAATGLLTEIIYAQLRVGDVLGSVGSPLQRAQEGTTAQNWLAGDLVANLCTAGQMAAMQQTAALQPARTAQTGGGGGIFAMSTADNGGGVALDRTLPVTTPSSTTLPTSPNGATYSIEDTADNFNAAPVTVNFPGGTTGPNGAAAIILNQAGQCARFRFYSDTNTWSYKP